MSPEDLFGEVPPSAPTTKKESRKDLAGHLWTEQKSLLIAEYIHGFLHVTKSGAFVDLFAGPQNEDQENYEDDWSIKRVIERRDASAPCVSYFAACDTDAKQIARLTKLKGANADREITFDIYRGDANAKIGEMLAGVPAKLPCFCLIDQRTFECDWATVQHIARFRTRPYKIELFYFLAAGWIDRARAKKKPELLRNWWGGTNYDDFFQLSGVGRAVAMAKRFKTELGYKFAHPFTIHERGVDGRTMYYMIHASDHHRASALMADAYNAVKRIGFDAMDQGEMFPKLDSEPPPQP